MNISAAVIACFLLCPALTIAFCFEEAGRKYGINSRLLASIARVESNMNPKALNLNKNGTSDFGLMQINSFWIKPLALDMDKLISNPCYNTMTGANILRYCLDRHGYNWKAVGCYNASSKPKMAEYSWKIFQMLKTEHNMKDCAPCTEKSAGDTISTEPVSQTFYFKAWNINGEEP